jgi:hypothetical protein
MQDGGRLTPEQLRKLNALCKAGSGVFQVGALRPI